MRLLFETGGAKVNTQKPVEVLRSAGFLQRVKQVFSPPAVVSQSSANGRQVRSTPYDSAFLQLPDKLTPRQVLQILRAALAGDSMRLCQLKDLMLRSWPMLRKCSHELREPCSNTRFVVKSYSVGKGEAPSDTAIEKADLIRRAMANFAPNQSDSNERGFNGMVYDFGDAMLGGMSTVELLFHPPMDWGAGMEKLPRASCWANPRHFTFTSDGQLLLANPSVGISTFAQFTNSQTAGKPLDPKTFVVGKFQSQSGSILAEGYIAPLALYWAAMKFCYEPMLIAAQNFGAPYIDFKYPQGTSQADIDTYLDRLEQGLSNRVLGHVDGSEIVMSPGAHAASQNPQMDIVKLSDQYCCELLLGTEATTKQTAGKLGGSNNDSPQDKSKNERVRGLANWVATECLSHFVDAVLYQNYGDSPTSLVEKPVIEPDFTQPLTAQEKGLVMTALANCKTPLTVEDYYDMVGASVPEEGDKVINPSTGEIGLIGSTEEDYDVSQAAPPVPVKLDANNNPIPAKTPEQAHGIPAAPVAAKLKLPVNRILAKATPEEVEQIIPILNAAEFATHRNGDHAALTKKLLEIQDRR